MKVNLNKRLQVISPFGGRNRKSNAHSINLDLYIEGNKRCAYCNERVFISNKRYKVGTATADHVYSKNDIRRTLDEATVLCCFKCNQERNDNETWSNCLFYNTLCFDYLQPYYKLEYRHNGHVLINGEYPDVFLERLNLYDLVNLQLLAS